MSIEVLSWTSSIHPIKATEGEDKNLKIAKAWLDGFRFRVDLGGCRRFFPRPSELKSESTNTDASIPTAFHTMS